MLSRKRVNRNWPDSTGEKMAIGAVLFSLPIALFSTLWVSLIHGYGATEAFAVYSAFGFLALLTVVTAIAFATGQRQKRS